MILSRPDLQMLVDSNPSFVVRRGSEPVVVDVASITLHLHDTFSWYTEFPKTPFVPPRELRTESRTLNPGEYLDFPPRAKILASSEEHVQMPLDCMGFIQTKGSIARAFVMTNMCDGQIDAGFRGRITFELVNLGDFLLQLVPGIEIAQLFVVRLSTALKKAEAYAGRYQGAERPTAMRGEKSHKP